MAEIRIRDQGKITVQDADSSNEVSLQAPSTVASNQEFTLPSTSGSANNLITTNASGVLSITDINTLVASDVAWQSTVKTGDFTAVSGEGYFVNTTSGAITATLPSSPSAGDFVAFKDYAETFASNNLTIGRNGSNIQGNANNSVLNTNRASVVLVYVDSTEGWLFTVENNVGDLEKALYVTATGGTITTSGDFKIHTFLGDGTFTVSDAGNSAGSNTVDFLVIAGGGGGGGQLGGGGGAGGYRESFPNPASGGLSVSAQGYPITIGGGGNPGPQGHAGGAGGVSTFSTITSAGGGFGGRGPSTGGDGGSGGGGYHAGAGGSGNTPPVSPPQGNDGGAGDAPTENSGGGGGAGGAGVDATVPKGGNGGNGATSSINASPVTRAGGGGGGAFSPGGSRPGGTGGPGGGGNAGPAGNTPGSNGTTNSGGGGGGATYTSPGGSIGGTGGSGIVIIRYKYQN